MQATGPGSAVDAQHDVTGSFVYAHYFFINFVAIYLTQVATLRQSGKHLPNFRELLKNFARIREIRGRGTKTINTVAT